MPTVTPDLIVNLVDDEDHTNAVAVTGRRWNVMISPSVGVANPVQLYFSDDHNGSQVPLVLDEHGALAYSLPLDEVEQLAAVLTAATQAYRKRLASKKSYRATR